MRPLYRELAHLVSARANCMKDSINNVEWQRKHEDFAEQLVKDYMPSGSGFDSGTKLDWDTSHIDKLVFTTAFHHMDDNGFYDGWTEHTVTVTPCFDSFRLRISGRNRNDIKEMMYEQFSHCLETDVEWDVVKTWPTAQGVEIHIEPTCDYKYRHFVTHRGVEVFTPDTEDRGFSGLELCRAFAVKFVKEDITRINAQKAVDGND